MSFLTKFLLVIGALLSVAGTISAIYNKGYDAGHTAVENTALKAENERLAKTQTQIIRTFEFYDDKLGKVYNAPEGSDALAAHVLLDAFNGLPGPYPDPATE